MRPLRFSVGYSGQPATPFAFSRLPRSADGHGTPPPAREEAARALVNLAVDDDNKVAIAQAGGVMPLITCLSPRRAYYV